MDKAFIIETKHGRETYIGTKSKIRSYCKNFDIVEEMTVEEWQEIERKKLKK